MSTLAFIFLSTFALLIAAFAYLWYVTPSPQDLAEEVLSQRRRKRTISAATFRTTMPQVNMTYINCLS